MLKSYNDIKVTVNWATPLPWREVRAAMDMTMKQEINRSSSITRKQLKFLFAAEHTEVVEHAVISFTFHNISRSLLAQITRQRLASKTSASQHYQVYSDYPQMISEKSLKDHPALLNTVFNSVETAYSDLLRAGIPKEEARQVLPNAKAVNLMYTTNAVALFTAIRKRSCLRNVEEMCILMDKIWLCLVNWWPEYAHIVGPPCYFNGKCNQGHMKCGKEWIPFAERLKNV